MRRVKPTHLLWGAMTVAVSLASGVLDHGLSGLFSGENRIRSMRQTGWKLASSLRVRTRTTQWCSRLV